MKKNRGAAYSRNIGITHAKGKYIMFLDADDYLDTNALEIYYETMEKSQAQGCFIRFQISSDHASNETGIIHEYKDVYRGLDLLDRLSITMKIFYMPAMQSGKGNFYWKTRYSLKIQKLEKGVCSFLRDF